MVYDFFIPIYFSFQFSFSVRQENCATVDWQASALRFTGSLMCLLCFVSWLPVRGNHYSAFFYSDNQPREDIFIFFRMYVERRRQQRIK